jgi:hypothetical protein
VLFLSLFLREKQKKRSLSRFPITKPKQISIMFSPVYEDVSGLFGRPVPVSSYGPSGELHFPPTQFAGGRGGGSQTPTQPPPQQQQMRTATFSLVDAAGNFISQQSMQQHHHQQQQQQSMASSMNGISFNTLNGSSIVPFEVYLQQQQQQAGQVAALSAKPTAFQTSDGVKYYIASPRGTPVLTGQATGVLRQQGTNATVYAIEHSGSANAVAQSGSFFSASLSTNGMQSSSGDFSFFVANGLSSSTTAAANLAVNPNTGIMSLSPDQRSRTLVNNTPALNMQVSVNRNVTVAELVGNKASIEVFDPDFKFIYDVPSSAVVHLPPARLNITRLVLCRNYRPYDAQSCAMGGNCKFVHADCDYTKLEAHPIHVNYIWRHESLCTYPRLPAGEKLKVAQMDGQVVEMPSERILVTQGSQALTQNRNGAPLSSCDSYENNGMCYQGERCCCIHTVVVDPFVQGDFKRAPRKREVPSVNSGRGFIPAAMQRSNSTASGEHSQAQPLVVLQPKQQQQRRQADTPETEESSSSTTTHPAGRGAATASACSTPVEAMLSTATLARLQEAVSTQLRPPATSSPQPIAPSFGISLTPFAIQTLTNPTSAGTLLYLPRGAVEAVVVGPVKAAESLKSNSRTPRFQQ